MTFSGWLCFLILLGSPRVRPMAHTCGGPYEIELSQMILTATFQVQPVARFVLHGSARPRFYMCPVICCWFAVAGTGRRRGASTKATSARLSPATSTS